MSAPSEQNELTLSRDEVRTVDRYAIDRLGIPGVVLMENAGRTATDLIEQFLEGVESKPLAIVAGSGNNGGDGFVIARHLHMRGAQVTVLVVVDPERITGDARINLDVIRKLGLNIREVAPEQIGSLAEILSEPHAVIDAVGGTGITGELRGPLAAAVEQINASGKPVIAIDIPTGLDCDTGTAKDPAVRANLTITMLARKKGFDQPGSREYTGKVRVVDIGIPAEHVARLAFA